MTSWNEGKLPNLVLLSQADHREKWGHLRWKLAPIFCSWWCPQSPDFRSSGPWRSLEKQPRHLLTMRIERKFWNKKNLLNCAYQSLKPAFVPTHPAMVDEGAWVLSAIAGRTQVPLWIARGPFEKKRRWVFFFSLFFFSIPLQMLGKPFWPNHIEGLVI